MAAGKRGVHQFAHPRMTRMRFDIGAGLDRGNDVVGDADVEHRVDALAVHIHRHGDDVHVAGTFTIAEQGAFNAVSTGQQGEFGRRHATATVVVGMNADDQAVALVYVVAEPFHLIGEYVGHGAFNGGGQIDNGFALWRRLPHTDHGVAHLYGVFHLGG